MRALLVYPGRPLRSARSAAAGLIVASCICLGAAAPASAFNPIKPICTAAGVFSGTAGKVCDLAQHPGRVVKASQKLLTGHPAQAVKTALGAGASTVASGVSIAVVLAGLVTWVSGGAKFALHETAAVLSKTTDPQLQTTWFSSTYWRVAGIAAVLTLPFLFAAAIQALMRSDLALLARAALGYLPLAMLAVGVAAPLTMLLLSASDQLSSLVASAAGNASGRFLNFADGVITGLTFFSRSPFLAFFVTLFTVAAAMVLWIELLMREAAVYVIVLMLPLAFAALVWPARRVWAVRAVELLVALIVSKFAIVAVLSLGGAALGSAVGGVSITSALAGFVLLVMGAFTPWALLRLLPLAELAAGATASLSGELRSVSQAHGTAHGVAEKGEEWVASTIARMRRDAEEAPGAPATENGSSTGAAGGATAEAERLEGIDESSLGSEEAPAAQQAPQEAPVRTTPTDASAAAPQAVDGVAAADGAPRVPVDSPIAPDATEHKERLADVDPIWREHKLRPITLGPDDGWPPQVIPEEDDPSPSPSDDPDPTPPAQEPQEGRL